MPTHVHPVGIRYAKGGTAGGRRTVRAAGRNPDTTATTQTDPRPRHGGRGGGRLLVVGIGPGGPLDRTRRAEQAIASSTVVVGYGRYLELIRDLTDGKETVSTGMTQELPRCRLALERAREGATVALVSSGDPGIYGMAGLVLELAVQKKCRVPIEIVPGITAASAAAARLGAPLMLDFAVISLSDLLVPWATIRQRLEAVASADLVVALYNPRSHKRVHQLDDARSIFLAHRPPTTPVGVATAVGTPEEAIVVSDLGHLLELDVGMRSMVIIGNRSSRRLDTYFVTPRGYRIDA
jgi:precorrin-3B C17-methyltransferase